jgi:hypothetical protein
MSASGQVPEGTMLVSGVEEHPETEDYRVFIGPRWARRYIVLGPRDAAKVWQAFCGTNFLYMKVPDDAEVFEETREENQAAQERNEKARILAMDKILRDLGISS